MVFGQAGHEKIIEGVGRSVLLYVATAHRPAAPSETVSPLQRRRPQHVTGHAVHEQQPAPSPRRSCQIPYRSHLSPPKRPHLLLPTGGIPALGNVHEAACRGSLQEPDAWTAVSYYLKRLLARKWPVLFNGCWSSRKCNYAAFEQPLQGERGPPFQAGD